MIFRGHNICQLLLDCGVISNDVYNKAREYQSIHGGDIVSYLVANRHITEIGLASFITEHIGIPYISINDYRLSPEAIDAVPVNLATKYMLMPLDKMGHLITIAMPDPLDAEAIEAVERATGCKALLFVSYLSDILKAIKEYYDVIIEDPHIKAKDAPPLFIKTASYTGIERRRALRLECDLEVDVPEYSLKNKPRIINASLNGFLLESPIPLTIGNAISVNIKLPGAYREYIINAAVQVVRVTQIQNGNFNIALKTTGMRLQDFKVVSSCIQSLWQD